MKVTKDDVVRQFGRMSKAYATSPGHAQGNDLVILLNLLKPKDDMIVLDVATGAGHTALTIAPYVKNVYAIDLTPEMVDRTVELSILQGIENIFVKLMDVEALDFQDSIFDAVACRIAPHHFVNIVKALSEIFRVLKPKGRFVMEDSCSPAEGTADSFINQIEKLRDPTHIRSYSHSEWLTMLKNAGFIAIRTEIYRKKHSVVEWLDRAGLEPKGKAQLYSAFNAASESDKVYFEIEYDGSKAKSYTDDKIILRAEKA